MVRSVQYTTRASNRQNLNIAIDNRLMAVIINSSLVRSFKKF